MKGPNPLLAAAIFAAASMSANGAEWFANGARPAGTGDGKTAETAFHTIQEAVDAAADGDTVTVMPGDYADGGYVDANGYTNRVAVIGKKLTLNAPGGRAVTRIVGAWDANGTHLNGDANAAHYPCMGPAAVRCVYLSGAEGTRFTGFTITGGASHSCPSALDGNGCGGGVLVADRKNAVFADCAIERCVASRGGGMYGGTAVRCLFEYNYTYYGTGQAARETRLVHSMVRRNARGGVGQSQLWGCTVVNCTVAQNVIGVVFQNCSLVNTVALLNGYNLGPDTSNIATNCVVASGQARWFAGESSGLSETSEHQLIAPAAGDMRLIAGCTAVTRGTAEALAAATAGLSDDDVYRDFDGAPIAKSGAIAAGCLQETVSPATGAWQFSARSVVNGYTNEVASCYAYATAAPAFLRVKMDLAEGHQPFMYSPSGASERFPLRDGSLVLMLPPLAEGVKNCNFYDATNFYYVAKSGSDSNDGRSKATAFKTIQRAIAAAPALSKAGDNTIDLRTIIFVGSGEYTAEDAVKTNNVSYVAYADYRRILVSGSGADSCVIRGAADSAVALDADPYGCGSNAVKCIGATANSIVCFQGFTIADGHGIAYSGTDWGGAVFGGGKGGYTTVADCIFTNCVGNRGAVYGAKLDRCRFIDCRDYYCTIRSAAAYSCVFEATESKFAPRDGFVGQDAEAYGCTMASRFNGQASFANSGTATILNSVVSQGKNASVSHKTDGNVYWGMSTYAGTGYVQADPAFADEAAGDYRLLSLSGAIGQGATTNAWWKYAGADIDGRIPLVTDGRLTPGAVQKTVAAVVVARPSNGSGTNIGTNAVEAGESITVTYTPDKRPLIGIVVDGVTNNTTSFTWTAPVEGDPIVPVSISALTPPHWYVNPQGNDAWDGWTPETAKKTLEGVMRVEGLAAGDTVHAAAGSYTNGCMVQETPLFANWPDPNWKLYARVVVPENVSLVADEGPEKTFIIGEKDTTEFAIPGRDGCGTNAMRCVVLNNYAVLRGFTVCGGRVYGDSTSENDNTVAGGIFCRSSGSSSYCPVVYDCIISNNWGRSGAGSYRGKYVGCRFLENHGYSSDPAGRYSSLYGCFIDRNYGAPSYSIYYALENCTFGSDNLALNGSRSAGLYVLQSPQSSAVAKNCVFLDRVRRGDAYEVVATNCVFRNDDESYSPVEAKRPGCKLLAMGEMLFDDGGYIPSRTSPLTDAADGTLMSDYAKAMDATGGRRIYNGAADIGAFEHDWRTDYAGFIGGAYGRTRVDEASENVVMDAGVTSLVMGPGATLSVTFTGGSTGATTKYTQPFTVAGAGTLSLSVNGEAAVEHGAGAGEAVFRSRLPENTIAFAYDAEDGDAGVLIEGYRRKTSNITISFR